MENMSHILEGQRWSSFIQVMNIFEWLPTVSEGLTFDIIIFIIIIVIMWACCYIIERME